jgi:RNA polymerase sigma-70 factor (ECF subfamily)
LAETAGVVDFDRARQAADERDLVAAAVLGSVPAFEQLYRLHVSRVYGLCLRMTREHSTAEDCTQEAFIQAWRALPAFQGRSGFSTWLHRIAVNAVLARARKRREVLGDEASIDEVADATADGGVEDPGASRDLEVAIGRLPPGARHVLVLSGVYGYSHEETADMLGIAVGTCKAQLHRARQLLTARLHLEEASA